MAAQSPLDELKTALLQKQSSYDEMTKNATTEPLRREIIATALPNSDAIRRGQIYLAWVTDIPLSSTTSLPAGE